MSILIGPAVPADAEALLAYLKQIGGETDNLSFGAGGLPVTPEQEAEYIAAHAYSRDSVMLVAKEDGRIVGDASLTRAPRRMSHRGELGVSVVKERWGEGIGARLMAEVLGFARTHGFEIIDLEVRSDNRRAIRLYQKFGFRTLCTYPAFLRSTARTSTLT